jgi:lipoate-protein ligase A
MALDALLFRRVCREGGSFLRFYGWDPPGVSLGRNQEPADGIDLAFCRRRGIPLVRRPTGGRAVFHHRELTYSFGTAGDGPWSRLGLSESHLRVAQTLADGLSRLGVRTDLTGRERRGGSLADCFAAPSRCELTWQGRKVVGSAQVRVREGFLQHGSILLEVERGLWREIFGPRGGEGAVSLGEILRDVPPVGEVEAAVGDAFARALGSELEPGAVAPEEEEAALADARRWLLPDGSGLPAARGGMP